MYWGYDAFNIFGSVLMLIFWVALVMAVIIFVKHFGRSGGWRGYSLQGESPLDILKQRYAKGEIDKKEFEEKKKDLS